MSIVLILTGLNSLQVEAIENPKRIFGKDRIETSVEISKVAFGTSNTIILAGYNGQVDSLSGTILASFKNAPMIYAGKDREKLDPRVLKRIQELNASQIYILGGDKVVSQQIEDSLSNLYDVIRIKGDRREETAVNVAQEVMGETINEVFLTLGHADYADALAIGPVSGQQQKPIFLTKTASLSKDTKDALKRFGVKRVSIIGGEKVIGKSVENEIKSMGILVNRVDGKNRVETAINIAKEYSNNTNEFVIANGYEFPDAVIGGYFAAKKNASILLAKDKLISNENLDYITNKNANINVLGGEKAINIGIVDDINFIINQNVKIEDVSTDFIENGNLKSVDRVYYKNGQ